jgi:hypothetical protein
MGVGWSQANDAIALGSFQLSVIGSNEQRNPIKETGQKWVYYPQVIPLLQWFEMVRTSNAIDGAFSFPDETALPHSAIPCPLVKLSN